jgi:hypothetical protein
MQQLRTLEYFSSPFRVLFSKTKFPITPTETFWDLYPPHNILVKSAKIFASEKNVMKKRQHLLLLFFKCRTVLCLITLDVAKHILFVMNTQKGENVLFQVSMKNC